MNDRRELAWEVGWSDCSGSVPVRWVAAEAPGAVQLDWARAEGWDSHTYGDNWKQYEWMEDKYWHYRTELPAGELAEGMVLYIVAKGIDYSFRIIVGEETLLKQEGMFTPVELDLTAYASEGAEIQIIIDPVPKYKDAHRPRAQASHSCKPAVSYGWDWHPRLIPLGIWDDIYLEQRTKTFIAAAEVRYELSEGLDKATMLLHATFSQLVEGTLTWTLSGPDGETVFRQIQQISGGEAELDAEVDHPSLWWPHDHGAHPLYVSEVSYTPVYDGDTVSAETQRIGFRRIKLVMHEGAWAEPSVFPKSRSHPPITLEINGRRIFGKGTNWVPPDIFYGRLTEETYKELLVLAKDANMNLLRVWGGGIVNKEPFFRLCDELGLLVWQEFPLACNDYPDDPDYLNVLDRESRSIIKRLRKHPSLAFWCGGNELFNSWSGMTDQSHALRLLNVNCYLLHREAPFLMTSPVDGMAHGHYVFRDDQGQEVFQWMPRANNTAYTEFGMPSPGSASLLRSFIPEAELFPPREGTAWESHHAFKAWQGDTWLMPGLLTFYFGEAASLEELIANGQLLQSEGYKCIYEEARRQQPRCSMALNWCYNEPWPCAANNSLISWPAEPKPAYYAVAASYRPVLASARIPKFTWEPGEWFEPEAWILNDGPESLEGGTLEIYVIVDGVRIQLLSWMFDPLEPGENGMGPTARWRVPRTAADRFKLEVVVESRPEWTSEYTLLYARNPEERVTPGEMLNI